MIWYINQQKSYSDYECCCCFVANESLPWLLGVLFLSFIGLFCLLCQAFVDCIANEHSHLETAAFCAWLSGFCWPRPRTQGSCCMQCGVKFTFWSRQAFRSSFLNAQPIGGLSRSPLGAFGGNCVPAKFNLDLDAFSLYGTEGNYFPSKGL